MHSTHLKQRREVRLQPVRAAATAALLACGGAGGHPELEFGHLKPWEGRSSDVGACIYT